MNAPLHAMLADEDLARADAYAVLARLLFVAPDADLLSTLRHSVRDGEGELTTAWNALCAAADDAKAIGDEYDHLFISISKPPVALYASWYLTGFLMEKPLALLRDDLAALGLSRSAGQNDPEDHIAGELDVMRHLIMRQNGDQANFFKRHLQPWYADLCAALTQAPGARFYRVLADFMRVFLNMERDYFSLQAAAGGVR